MKCRVWGFAGPFPPWGVPAVLSPSPLSLLLSRGDQCLTNNSTYFEVTAGDTTLVKHGEQLAQPPGSPPRLGFGWAETRKTPMLMFHII